MADCPVCNTRLSGDETFCLQCGTRLVPVPQPRQSWAVPAAIIAAIALVGTGVVLFALDRVESDAKREAREPALVVRQPEPPGTARPGDVTTWPSGTSGYTVLLAEAPDETTARTRATAAVRGGIAAGVLQSDAYPTLEPGRWLLFAGRFETRAQAVEEAARYVAAGFPDAEAAFVSE